MSDAPDEEYLCTDLSIGNSVLQQVETTLILISAGHSILIIFVIKLLIYFLVFSTRYEVY